MPILKADGTPYKPITDEIAGPTTGGIRSIWSNYPSSGLTPVKLAAILKLADQGIIASQMELFEEMEEKDPHLFSVLQTRKRSVANLPWEISPASDSAHDKKIADAVKQQMRYIPRFKQALIDLLDAIGKGIAISEIIWGISSKEIYVEKLIWRHQKWFTFDQDTGSEVRLRTDAAPLYGEELPPDKFITPILKAKSGIAARGGISRICTWMYLFKNYDVKDWVAFAEVFGMPLRVGKYPAGSQKKDREVLQEALINLGQDTSCMIPEAMKIEFVEAKASGGKLNIYKDLADFCDAQTSKAILGQTLTTDQGTVGSQALGNVHEGVRYELVKSDAEEISEVLTEQLVRPLVIFNYGEQDNYPEFQLIAKKPEDLKTQAEIIKTLGEGGFRGTPVSWVHEKFGIPVPKDGEEVLEPSQNSGGVFPAKNQPDYILAGKKKLHELRGYPTKPNSTD